MSSGPTTHEALSSPDPAMESPEPGVEEHYPSEWQYIKVALLLFAITMAQITLFTCGVGVLLRASDWPLHDLAERYLYSAHMVQHMLMTFVAAPLLLLGTPEWLARGILRRTRLLRPVRFFGRPVPDLIQFN